MPAAPGAAAALARATPARSAQSQGWQHVVSAARKLLSENERTSSPARRKRTSRDLLPLLKLGSKLGEGSNCEVVAAYVRQDEDAPAMGWPSMPGIPTRLAVKMYHCSHTSDRGAGAVMREVMWEVRTPPGATRLTLYGSVKRKREE